MKLWFVLRDRRLGRFKFVRQEAIGPYVIDFICREEKLVVEVEGGQQKEGYRVLRFWNNDVMSNIDGVATSILAALHDG